MRRVHRHTRRLVTQRTALWGRRASARTPWRKKNGNRNSGGGRRAKRGRHAKGGGREVLRSRKGKQAREQGSTHTHSSVESAAASGRQPDQAHGSHQPNLPQLVRHAMPSSLPSLSSRLYSTSHDSSERHAAVRRRFVIHHHAAFRSSSAPSCTSSCAPLRDDGTRCTAEQTERVVSRRVRSAGDRHELRKSISAAFLSSVSSALILASRVA